MKTFLLLSIALLVAFNVAWSQGDFAPIGAKWHYDWASTSSIGETGRKVGYILQESIKDTIITGQVCRKLVGTLYSKVENTSDPVETSLLPPIYVYATPDTVFYYNEDFNRFLTLNVFNVNVGDTVYYRSPFPFSSADSIFRMKITGVTLITVSGVPLKRIEHEPLDLVGFGLNHREPYTEKIGTINTPSRSHFSVGLPEISLPKIRCYVDDEIEYKEDPDVPCDYINGITGIGKVLDKSQNLVIFPNPVSNTIHFKIQDLIYGVKNLELYDVMGKRVNELTLRGSSGRMDVTGLAKGVYLLKIYMGNFFTTRKIIID